jgi:hypothetical protein
VSLLDARWHSLRRPTIPIRPNRPRVGRIQTRVRRELIASGRPLTTRELMDRIYPRPTQHWQYRVVRGAAAKFAEPVRRIRRPGHPWVWRLKD